MMTSGKCGHCGAMNDFDHNDEGMQAECRLCHNMTTLVAYRPTAYQYRKDQQKTKGSGPALKTAGLTIILVGLFVFPVLIPVGIVLIIVGHYLGKSA